MIPFLHRLSEVASVYDGIQSSTAWILIQGGFRKMKGKMNIDRRSFIRTSMALAGCCVFFPRLASGRRSALPKVLILGDSISVGYTPYVKEMLAGEADVVRPEENCQGTTHALKNIDKWLGDTRWDVVHFNFGLHDLKHVDPVVGKNSNKPEDPQQADVRSYSQNLKVITKKLKQRGAKLIFATTTPFPDKPDGPLRRSEEVPKYNRSALKIMKKNRIAVNDLYTFALPKLKSLQIPNNVHFTKEGSSALAKVVVESIRTIMKS